VGEKKKNKDLSTGRRPGTAAMARSPDALPSWNDGSAKSGIMEFVLHVTTMDSPWFVPPHERIAVFDNDGTLWSERPAYFQALFAMDRIRDLAPQHPDWQTTQPFRAVLENDMEALIASGMKGLVELLMASHAGMTTTEFENIVRDWIMEARHPRFNRLYTELVFQPMLELLGYLHANGFQTYIVSAGGIEFLRAWSREVYGIPPENVIGSSIKTRFELRDDGPVLVRLPEIDFVNDHDGKPVCINKFIGLRPIAAFGNSDGDLQMLQWTAAGKGRRLMLLVHHTDAQREWAYNRQTKIGHLDKALDEAGNLGWVVVDMSRDWRVIYPFELEQEVT
jgi:hypothetical protein